MEFCIKLIFVQPYISSEDTLCYIPLLFHAFPFIFSFFTELRPTYYITPGPKRKPRSSRLLDKPAASDYNTKKEFADVLFAYFSHQLRERIFFMEPKTKQYLLITVVGVTLFVALLRLSSVLAFAAQLVDLVLPILAGGILALFINVPMTGLEKRLKRLFCKAKKQPSDKVLHLLSFFITLLDQCYWVASAGLGAVVGSVLPFSTEGVDFVMTAMFTVIFLNQWEKDRQHYSALIGLAAPLACLVFFGSGSFLLPSMGCILILLLALRKPIEKAEGTEAEKSGEEVGA